MVGYAVIGLLPILACGKDGGIRRVAPEPPPPPPPGNVEITGLLPARTVVADTVLILGSGFGDSTGSVVSFAGSGDSRVPAQVLSWSDARIRALVPQGALDGPVRVHSGTTDSNALDFSVAPRLISYTGDLLPQVFNNVRVGCTGCHGGQNNLFLDSARQLMEGNSLHGPVVIPRDSAGSILLQKVSSSPPFGDRMPQGGNPLTQDQLLLISDWIDQGARDD
jgi:hypothetical protein